MDAIELRAALEAIFFVSTEPVNVDDLVGSFPDVPREEIDAQLNAIRLWLDEHAGGFILEQTAGGWRFATRAEHDPTLKRYFAKKGENRLSIAALEALAIIGYRQPITAPEISEIRGVNSIAVIRTLLERRMIRVAGRKNVVGSPFLYRTTKEFLVHFGLNDIRDLPRLEEFGEMIGESMSDDLVAAIASAEQTPASEVQEITDADERERAESEAMAELAREEEHGTETLAACGERGDEPGSAPDARGSSARKSGSENHEGPRSSSHDEVESSRGDQE